MAPASSSIGIVKSASNVFRKFDLAQEYACRVMQHIRFSLPVKFNCTGQRWTVFHQLTEVYRPSISKQKERLVEIINEKAEMARKSELARKMKVFKGFYTLEMSPPTTNEKQKLVSDLKLIQEFMKSGAIGHLTVRQAWLLFLVGLEVYLWFFIGETIAKGRIVGYAV